MTLRSVAGRLAAVSLGGALAATLAGCSGSRTVYHKVSVAIEENGRSFVGSGVWSFRISTGWPVASFDVESRGEAIPIRLPGKRTAFAIRVSADDKGLPRLGYVDQLPELVFGDDAEAQLPKQHSSDDRAAVLDYIAKHMGLHATFRCEGETQRLCPMVVFFKDINDPGSVQIISAQRRSSETDDSARVAEVSVEVVDGPITTGVTKLLPWLPSYFDKMLDGQKLSNNVTLANNLSVWDFSTELRP